MFRDPWSRDWQSRRRFESVRPLVSGGCGFSEQDAARVHNDRAAVQLPMTRDAGEEWGRFEQDPCGGPRSPPIGRGALRSGTGDRDEARSRLAVENHRLQGAPVNDGERIGHRERRARFRRAVRLRAGSLRSRQHRLATESATCFPRAPASANGRWRADYRQPRRNAPQSSPREWGYPASGSFALELTLVSRRNVVATQRKCNGSVLYGSSRCYGGFAGGGNLF